MIGIDEEMKRERQIHTITTTAASTTTTESTTAATTTGTTLRGLIDPNSATIKPGWMYQYGKYWMMFCETHSTLFMALMAASASVS